MKYLKTFENNIHSRFKVGDYIKLLYSFNDDIQIGFNCNDIYRILDIDFNDFKYPYEIEFLDSSNFIWTYYDQIRLAFPYEINANKYNL